MTDHDQTILGGAVLLGAAAVLACAATLIPLVYLVIRAGERGPASAAEVLGSGRTLTLLGNTVVLVVLVTTASVTLACTCASLSSVPASSCGISATSTPSLTVSPRAAPSTCAFSQARTTASR